MFQKNSECYPRFRNHIIDLSPQQSFNLSNRGYRKSVKVGNWTLTVYKRLFGPDVQVAAYVKTGRNNDITVQ